MIQYFLTLFLIIFSVLGCSSANVNKGNIINSSEILTEINVLRKAKLGEEILSVKNTYQGNEIIKKVYFEGADPSISSISLSVKGDYDSNWYKNYKTDRKIDKFKTLYIKNANNTFTYIVIKSFNRDIITYTVLDEKLFEIHKNTISHELYEVYRNYRNYRKIDEFIKVDPSFCYSIVEHKKPIQNKFETEGDYKIKVDNWFESLSFYGKTFYIEEDRAILDYDVDKQRWIINPIKFSARGNYVYNSRKILLNDYYEAQNIYGAKFKINRKFENSCSLVSMSTPDVLFFDMNLVEAMELNNKLKLVQFFSISKIKPDVYTLASFISSRGSFKDPFELIVDTYTVPVELIGIGLYLDDENLWFHHY